MKKWNKWNQFFIDTDHEDCYEFRIEKSKLLLGWLRARDLEDMLEYDWKSLLLAHS